MATKHGDGGLPKESKHARQHYAESVTRKLATMDALVKRTTLDYLLRSSIHIATTALLVQQFDG